MSDKSQVQRLVSGINRQEWESLVFFHVESLEVEAEAVTGLRLSTHMALRQTQEDKI